MRTSSDFSISSFVLPSPTAIFRQNVLGVTHSYHNRYVLFLLYFEVNNCNHGLLIDRMTMFVPSLAVPINMTPVKKADLLQKLQKEVGYTQHLTELVGDGLRNPYEADPIIEKSIQYLLCTTVEMEKLWFAFQGAPPQGDDSDHGNAVAQRQEKVDGREQWK